MKSPASVVLATGNAGKVREFARLFDGAFELSPLPQGVVLPEETGHSFAENARLKALDVFQALGGRRPVLADDSGLEVRALDGRPGVYSARFAGEGASDAENVAKLLRELEGIRDRSAQFVCALCLVVPEDDESSLAGGSSGTGALAMSATLVEVEGHSRGVITAVPRGLDGFGYDPVFRPDTWRETLAEALPEAKDSVSHRGAAARALLDRLVVLEGS